MVLFNVHPRSGTGLVDKGFDLSPLGPLLIAKLHGPLLIAKPQLDRR